MWFLYLDESGDLGFDFVNKKPSKFFTVTILAIQGVSNNRKLINVVKKTIRRKLTSKKMKRQPKELKGSSTTDELKRYFYALAEPLPFALFSISLNKKKVYEKLTKEKSRVYNKPLQAVDMFCWGFFQKYERQNTEWVELFHAKVKFDQMYLL